MDRKELCKGIGWDIMVKIITESRENCSKMQKKK